MLLIREYAITACNAILSWLTSCGRQCPISHAYVANCVQVQWMKTEFDMSSSKHRALFLFAVSNLTRWITLVAQQLPELALRMLLLLKPWERDAHVTITLQSAGR